MTQMTRTTSLLLALMAGWFVPVNLPAQAPPVFPRLKGIGRSNISGYGTGVRVAGSRAYLTWAGGTSHPGGLEIYNVTNPAAPLRVGGYESQAQAHAVHVAGHYAYLAEGTARTLTNDPGVFEIIDVSNPANPVRVGGLDTVGRANEVHVVGNYAYVPESTRWTGSNLLGALEILDISTPTNPIRVSTYDTDGSATSVAVSGGFAYLADGVTDLQVVDVSDPANPRRAGGYDRDERVSDGAEFGGPATYIRWAGDLVYSAGENGVHLLDVTTPSNPVRIGGDGALPFPYAFHVSDRRIYAAFWSSLAHTLLLFVFDAGNPTNLTAVGRSEMLGWPRDMQVKDGCLYLATIPLLVYEISVRPVIKSISSRVDSLILTWDNAPGFVLQRATSPANPLWSDVPGSTNGSGIELPLTSGSEYFRLARPQPVLDQRNHR